MPYGFVIDQTRCIGCHACTVACKSENDVPVGDFRTWVKYTEIGTFPKVRRHFAVLRCNHCTNAPCVTICPVTALHKRGDGIVDLDRDVCIGCKACMQACPYDALYLNEDTGGAEKCHYCAHRVDQGLQPACVVVCPEEAIVSGDFADPQSRIAKLRSSPGAVVRRPEQNTGPNVHYIGADPVSLDPGRAREPSSYLWSERRLPPPDYPDDIDLYPDATTVLDVNHKVHWGPMVSAYLVTKGISAGAVMLAPLFAAGLLQTGNGGGALELAPEIIGLLFLTVTLGLLVGDLKRPHKFLSILLRPNTRSWLVKGAWVLTGFGAAVAAVIAGQLLELPGFVAAMRYAGMVLGVGAAGYTALLFAQCEGRDLWQNTGWLFPHLLAQALMLGASVLLPFDPLNRSLVLLVLIGAVAHHVIALREAYGHHPTTNSRLAAALMVRVPVRPGSRWMACEVGTAATSLAAIAGLALFGLGAMGSAVAVILFVVICAGTFLYEQAYIRAGQLPPLS